MNRKRCIRKNEKKDLKVPNWPEMAIHRIWPQAELLPRFIE